jgi:hypothetical protein
MNADDFHALVVVSSALVLLWRVAGRRFFSPARPVVRLGSSFEPPRAALDPTAVAFAMKRAEELAAARVE